MNGNFHHSVPTGQMALEFSSAGFYGGRKKNGEPEENPRSKDENQQQTQPTYDAGSGNRTQETLVGGERSHHCAIPAPGHIHIQIIYRLRIYNE